MHVHINVTWIDLNKQNIERETSIRDQALERLRHGVVEIVAANEPVVDKYELLPSRFACRLRPSDITHDTDHLRFFLNGCQLLLVVLAKDADDALAQLSRLE